MQNFNKNLIVTVSVLVFSLVFGFSGPNTAHALVAIGDLGDATNYSVWGKTGITGGAFTTAWGDAGENGTGNDGTLAGDPASTYHPEANAATVGVDINDQRLALDGATPTGSFALNAADVAVGPGVYTVTNSGFSHTLTLNGAGTYVFQRKLSNIAQTSGGTMILNGACASDIYWEVGTDMAFATGTGVNMYGTIIAGTTIAFQESGLTLQGRALTDTSVTLGNFTIHITQPVTCTPVAGTCGTDATSYLHDATTFSGTLCTLGSGVATPASPVFPSAGNSVTWTCGGSNGGSSSATCTATVGSAGGVAVVTSYYSLVPPLIDVLKVPSPLALPNGPGPVTYTYTLRNIGTVPMTNITIVDDTCSPMIFLSGDTNGDSKLDMNETWTYDCFKTLSATHTNTVVATGWANGVSATDIATATVVVGVPIVPPLIHVTKVPSPLALPAGGGAVTYTYTVTNPGTAPLSNVSIIDDKCTGLPGRVLGHPGDLNKNDLLESNETWTFTCKSNLTKTTTNIGTASGDANGLTARDFAIATVVVAPTPTLPNAGFGSDGKNIWPTVLVAGVLMLILTVIVAAFRKRTI